MRSSLRHRRSLLALAALAAALATVFTTASPAAVDSAGAVTAGHKCLVMTGSGDPAFVKDFNPYTATSLPSGAFVRGAFYEPLIIATVAGGGHLYPWLAQSWKWSHGNRTLPLNLAKNMSLPGC